MATGDKCLKCDGHGYVFLEFGESSKVKMLCEDCVGRQLAALRADVERLTRERDDAREQLQVSEQIGGTFWEAIKPLALKAINVANPGSHVTDVICERDTARSEVEQLRNLLPRCPECGYSKEDCDIHMDHHLCKGPGPAEQSTYMAARAEADRLRTALEQIRDGEYDNAHDSTGEQQRRIARVALAPIPPTRTAADAGATQ